VHLTVIQTISCNQDIKEELRTDWFCMYFFEYPSIIFLVITT
jgi:hypothetical protein